MALRNVTMEHLIAAAAHLEAPNKQGRAPLHIAAASNNFRALRKLLNAGAHRAPIDAVSSIWKAPDCKALLDLWPALSECWAFL